MCPCVKWVPKSIWIVFMIFFSAVGFYFDENLSNWVMRYSDPCKLQGWAAGIQSDNGWYHSPRAVPKPGRARSWSNSQVHSKSCSVSYSLTSLHSFYFLLKLYDDYKEALVLLSIESKGQTGFMSCPPYYCLFHAFSKGGLAFTRISSLWNSAP